MMYLDISLSKREREIEREGERTYLSERERELEKEGVCWKKQDVILVVDYSI